METLVRNIITFSVSISSPYDKAWDYLTNPLNQKEWAIHFVSEIELKDNMYWATLPFGTLPLRLETDKESGVIDMILGDGEPIRTRLVPNGPDACMYIFTLPQPPNMPDEVWETVGVPNMEEELNVLKSILENQ